MSLTSFFGNLGHAFASPKAAAAERIATGLASAGVGLLNPGLGALVEMIGNAVYTVQEASPATTPGTNKKAQVQHVIDVSTPVTLDLLSRISGKTLEHPEAVAPALDSMIDSLVTLFHAIGVFQPATLTTKPTATPVAPATAPATPA